MGNLNGIVTSGLLKGSSLVKRALATISIGTRRTVGKFYRLLENREVRLLENGEKRLLE